MTRDPISRRQMSALILVAMLSPVFRVLPRRIVGTARGMSWLSILLAIPPALLLLFLLGRAMAKRRANQGLAELLLDSLGRPAGRCVLVAIALWMLFYAGFLVRNAAERYISTAYPQSHIWPFLLILLGITVPAILGSLPPLARSAVIFCPLILGMLLLVAFLLAPDVDIQLLRPSLYGMGGTIRAVAPVLEVLAATVYFAFLGNHVPPGAGFFRRYSWLVFAILGLSAVFCAGTVGVLGPAMTEETIAPFFSLLRDLSIFHLTERMEVFVIALWVISDFLLVSALQLAAYRCLHLGLLGRAPVLTRRSTRPGQVSPMQKDARWLLWVGLAAVAATSIWIAHDSVALQPWSDTRIPLSSAIITFIILPASLLIGKLRRRI